MLMISCGYSMSTICEFNEIKIKYDAYRSKGCMKQFCESLKEHAAKIINFQKKKMAPLTKKSLDHMLVKKTVKYVKTNFKTNMLMLKKYCKVIDHCHYTGKCRGTAQNIFRLKHSMSKEILLVVHDESNYDYHFIIKELAEEF